MAIFEATTDPTVIQGVLDRVLELIRTTGGNPGAIDRWGKRTFAYEVNHKREGYYVVVEFTAGPQTVADLDRMLGLADEMVAPQGDRPVARLSMRGRSGQGAEASQDRPSRPPTDLGSASRDEREHTMPTDNSVILVGNITRDPELRFTNTGQPDRLPLRVGQSTAGGRIARPKSGEEATSLLRCGVLARRWPRT